MNLKRVLMFLRSAKDIGNYYYTKYDGGMEYGRSMRL